MGVIVTVLCRAIHTEQQKLPQTKLLTKKSQICSILNLTQSKSDLWPGSDTDYRVGDFDDYLFLR